jgi:hypothetical protein
MRSSGSFVALDEWFAVDRTPIGSLVWVGAPDPVIAVEAGVGGRRAGSYRTAFPFRIGSTGPSARVIENPRVR